MATLTINGQRVTVDDSFLSLSPEQQEATVDEIAQSLGAQPARVDPATNQPPGVPEYVPPGVEGYDSLTGEVTRQPQGRLSSAAYGAADTATFGFGDELASYLGSAITGVPREQVLSEMRGMQKQAREDNPGSYLAGQIGGGLAQGIATGGAGFGTSAARAGGGLWKVALGGAVDGAIYGGLYGSGSAEGGLSERAKGGGFGALTGGVVGGAMPVVAAGVSKAARKAISPFTANAERTAAAQALRAEGVPVTAGQITGNRRLRFAEAELGGRKAADVMDNQAEAFSKAVLKRAGINASKATPEVIDTAFDQVGKRFDSLAAKSMVRPDQQMITELRDVFNHYGQITPETMRSPIVQDVVNDIVKSVGGGKPISGQSYQNITSRLARAARGATNPDLKQTLYGIREVLDGAMERSLPQAQAGAWRAARNQYRNLLAVEQAATRAGEAASEGLISPANIRNAVINQGRRAYARGQGDFADLARAGSMLLSPLPSSGTSERLLARSLVNAPAAIGGILGGTAGNVPGGIMGMAAGAALPRVAGSALMSRPVQSYLANQAAVGAGNPIRQAVSAGLLTKAAIPAIPRR